MLGFDALGRLALGQVPNPKPVPFSNWSSSARPTLSTAVVSTTFSGFVAPLTTTPVVFATFSQPTPVRAPQSTQPTLIGQTVALTATPTALVFSSFSQPSFKPVRTDPDVNFRVLRPDSATPASLVFSTFSQPWFKSVRTDPDVNFRILRPDSATPTSLVFSKFSEPTKTTFKNSDVANVPVFITPTVSTVVTGGDFATFDLLKSRPAFQYGFTNNPIVLPTQPYVFSTFSQPSLRVVPLADKLFVGDRGPAQTPTWSTFSPFKELLTKKPQQDPSVGFIGDLGPAQTPSRLSFSDFGQPWQTKRPVIDDRGFLNFPIAVVQQQPYVFGQFDQPRQLVRVVPGFTNNQTFIAPQSYVFSPFEQPSIKRTLQIDSVQFVDNTPTVVVLTPDFSYSDFGIPFYSKQTGISFTNSPLQPIVAPDNNASFSGFSTFILQLPRSYHVEQHPGVAYEIIVPDVLVEDVIAGKRWKVQTRESPKTIPVVSSNIAEVTFDKDSNELNVKFNNGKVYNYANIDSKKAKGLVRAKSSGKYLHNNIKGKYFTTRIK